MPKIKSYPLSLILTLTLTIFTCGSAWAVVKYQADNNTADIKEIKELHAKDHDVLIRVDAYLKILTKEK